MSRPLTDHNVFSVFPTRGGETWILITYLPVFYRLHTLGANELYQAHLAPYLARTQSLLDSKQDSVEKENLQLAEKIGQQRTEVQQLLSRLNAVVGDVDGAASALRQFDAENHIRKDAEAVDDEINANPSR